MAVTIDQLRKAAEKAGMSKFMFLDDEKGPKKDVPYVIGHDFLERLHAQLVKAEGSVP